MHRQIATNMCNRTLLWTSGFFTDWPNITICSSLAERMLINNAWHNAEPSYCYSIWATCVLLFIFHSHLLIINNIQNTFVLDKTNTYDPGGAVQHWYDLIFNLYSPINYHKGKMKTSPNRKMKHIPSGATLHFVKWKCCLGNQKFILDPVVLQSRCIVCQ